MDIPRYPRPSGWIIAVLVSALSLSTVFILVLVAAILLPWVSSQRSAALENKLRDDVHLAGQAIYDQQHTPDWYAVYGMIQEQQSVMGDNPYGTPGVDISLTEWSQITNTDPVPVSTEDREFIIYLGDGKKDNFCLVGWETSDPDDYGYPYGDFYYDPMLDDTLDTYELQDAYYNDELTPACSDLVSD